MKKILTFFALLTLSLLLLAGCEAESKVNETNTNVKEVTYEGSTIEINDEYNEWKLTPKFNYQTKDHGESVTYEIIGKKDGFGITGPFPIVTSKSGKGGKYFWFYWGGEKIKNQPVKIMAYKKGSKELIKLHSGEFYEGAQINESEVNMPSNLKFPSPGVWNLLVYINDNKLSGNIVVEVISEK